MADCWNVNSSFWLNLSCVFTFYNFQLYRYLFISTNYCDTGTDLEPGPTGTAPQPQQKTGVGSWGTISDLTMGATRCPVVSDTRERMISVRREELSIGCCSSRAYTHTQYRVKELRNGNLLMRLKLNGSISYRYLLHILIFRFLRICICISESMLLKLWPRMQIREKLPNLEP